MGAKSDKIADVIQQIKSNVPEGKKSKEYAVGKRKKNRPTEVGRGRIMPIWLIEPGSDHANMVDRAGVGSCQYD